MRIFALLILLVLSSAGNASPVTVGGTSIEVPAPAGFARVVPEMKTSVSLQRYTVPASNEQLAAFISQEDVPAALDGGVPVLARRFTVQVEKNLAIRPLTSSDFSQLKGAFKSTWEARVEQMKSQFSRFYSDASVGMSEVIDVNLLANLGGVVPIPYHFESEQILSGPCS